MPNSGMEHRIVAMDLTATAASADGPQETAARQAADTARRARVLNVRIIPRLRLVGIVVWLVLKCGWELAQD